MGFFDFMNNKLNEQVENNLDYLKKKARSASFVTGGRKISMQKAILLNEQRIS